MTNGSVRALGLATVVLAATVWLDAQVPGQGTAGAGAPRAASVPPGSAARGEQLFQKVGCYQCHGELGQGVINTYEFAAGPRLAPNPTPFRRFAQFTRGGPRSPELMPPYSSQVLSDQGLADIYAFLRAVPPPPPLDSIRLLAPEQLVNPSKKTP